MPEKLILAIDQGTTNTKALLVGCSGEPVFRAAERVALIQSKNNFVEQDPLELWSSVVSVMKQCATYAGDNGATIEGIAISNQRETAVAWNAETGMPVANAISWQCVRSAEICAELSSHAETFRHKTGLPLAPLASAGKWAWLLKHRPELLDLARRGLLHFGTVDSWLISKLTDGSRHVTDCSNASRTGLFNLDGLMWDEELLVMFGIPSSALPELRSSSGTMGTCSDVAELAGVPIVAAIGDSHAALVGHGSYRPGTIKATYGTGSSLMGLTSDLAAENPALARTVAWSVGNDTQFALEGNIAMTGSAVQWVGEFLGLANPTEGSIALADTVSEARGVYLVPAMVGLGAPHWNAAARGTITGLERSHTAAHMARAAMDAIAYQVADVFFAMEKIGGISIPVLHADGGATRNDQLMQFQADILERPVLRSTTEDLSALGAAWLGGIALGWWSSIEELERIPKRTEVFEPRMSASCSGILYRGWQDAVSRACMMTEGEA